MMAMRKQKTTLRDMHPESMLISEHVAELPASIVAASRMLRAAPELADRFTASVPIVGLQTPSLAALAVLLSGYSLRAEMTADDGHAVITFTRREDAEVSA
jgi:hypothetical protein